ncbi:lymphocyte antigen 6C1 isoform 2 precursor [Mus musculus]|uniref:Lymphocyte antigen 6 family member C1 n=1 Tax=Mus musculus TaxID=10090 RepID=A0A087WNZ5_MOUSE|nr:lymphocyte antigen 6C1 isoform 2 precursor [Mus musculus]|eukprot:NP_001238985.1 lymphocyte antigen 6C1 isoform 2 precursor [Mus musculus]
MDTSHTTKSCVLILLVALLCAERAQGLQCYECYGVPIETSCPAVTCRASDGFCIAQNIELIEDSQRRKLKTRQCLSFCPAGVPIRDPNIRERTSCCSEDLCNAAVPTAGIQGLMRVKKHHQAHISTGHFQGDPACGGEAQEMSNQRL